MDTEKKLCNEKILLFLEICVMKSNRLGYSLEIRALLVSIESINLSIYLAGCSSVRQQAVSHESD